MARRDVRLYNVKDFTGGLNYRVDADKLADNESPDLLNVDVDPRGGFQQRKGVSPFVDTMPGAVRSMWQYTTPQGSHQIMAQSGSEVVYSGGGSFSNAFNRQGAVQASAFRGFCYCVDGRTNSVRWNGSTGTAMFTTWNDDLEKPKGVKDDAVGTLPIASHIAVHNSTLWVANTSENGKRHPERIRFSHPNFPEDWRSTDFIDIEPGRGEGEITAMLPYGDRLLIFKKKAIYALYGYSPETYQVVNISREIGTVHADSVVNTDIGIFFWSWPDGLFLYTGKEPVWQFERLYPAILDGYITESPTNKVMLGWGNRRLWLSVTYGDSATRNRVYVLDPQLGKYGSWVQYDLSVGPFLEWAPPGVMPQFLAADVERRTVLRLEQNQAFDNFGAGPVPIKSHYRTKFFDLGQPAIPKRWRRPEVVMQGGAEAPVYVSAYRDWDPTRETRNFTLNPQAENPNLGANRWDEGLWDEVGWERTADGDEVRPSLRNEQHRGSPLGNARSIALLFRGPENLAQWGVNTLTLKSIPRKPKP